MHKLEKLNSSIDIIPLQSSSMENSNNSVRRLAKPIEKNRPDEGSGRIFRDPMIISRVKAYLFEHEDTVYIDVNEMADDLQRKHRDYRGKKRGPFRAMVRKAYDEITENLSKQTNTNWQDDEDEIDIESNLQVDPIPSDYLHNYKRQTIIKQNGNSSDKELIDISSDDDQIKTCTTSQFGKESMEVESMHKSKRPHLSSNMDAPKTEVEQIMKAGEDVQVKSVRSVKSRKRPREKETGDTFDTLLKSKTNDIPILNPSVKFSDIGGSHAVLETIANLLIHMKHSEIYVKLGISPPRGFLLHGPPGCGKTLLAHAIAGELKVPMLKVAAPELIAGISGESEQRIRDLFEQAINIAPCILFIDEIDSIAPHRATVHKEMERRIVSQLLSCLDELSFRESESKVLVLGATNRIDTLDPALRRAGRFDREVSLGIPDKEARMEILKVHTSKITISNEVSLEKISMLTPGFVGADLVALIREAAMVAVKRIVNDLQHRDFVGTLPIQPHPVKEKTTVDEKEKTTILVDPDVVIEEDNANIASFVDIKENQSIGETNVTQEVNKVSADKSDIIKSDEFTLPLLDTIQYPSAVTDNSESSTSNLLDSKNIQTVLAAHTSHDSIIETKAVEEITSISFMSQIEKERNKLEEVLTWLHNESPLTNDELAQVCVQQQDFDLALKNVQPSAKREGFATVPDVTWDDIGSLQDIRQELQMTILAPIRHAEHFAALGLTTPTGVLLCGPPGCGKTLLAKAIANEAGINFISVKGPELLNMYVGESEKAVRQCFVRARNSSPCVIFFDELDSLCPKRSEGDSGATSRVVNQMLTEMDGVESRKNVFLLAASNRPEIIDPAVLRPGRLDKILYVGLPSPADRVDILRALTKNGTKPKLASDVNIEEIGSNDQCTGYTGADLAALIREAGIEALREIMNGTIGSVEICARHLNSAFNKIRPSVQEKDIKNYGKLEKIYSTKRRQSSFIPMTTESLIDTPIEAMET